MKKKAFLSVLFILISTLLICNLSYANYKWEKLSFNADTSLYISPNYEQDVSIYALSNRELFKSTDEGNTWKTINELPVWQVKVTGNKTLYALQGTSERELALYSLQPSQEKMQKVCDMPPGTKNFAVLNNGVIIAARPSESRSIWHLLRSESPGTWQDTGFTRAGELLESMPDGTIFTRENGTNVVSRSINNGLTWKDVSSSYEINKLYASPLYPEKNEIFAIINNTAVYISYDTGLNWQLRMTGMEESGYLAGLAFSPRYRLDQTIYAADTEGRVFVSKDDAFNWKTLGVSFEDDNKLNSLIVLPNGKILAGTSKGVYQLTSYIPVTQLARAEFVIGKTTYTIGQNDWYMDAAPYVDGGRTFVPVRYLAYALGVNDSDILWDETKKEVTLTKGKTTVKMIVGSSLLFVNNQPVTMDVLPQMRVGRVFLPARWVAEAFGATVTWDGQKNSVVIEYQK